MKIGFDISQTGRYKAGCGYFADSLIQALTRLDQENSYILYPHFGTTFWDPNAEQGTRKIDLPHVSRKRIGRDFAGAMAFWSQLPPDAVERLGNPDIIHCNNYFCPKGLNGAKVVYTLYDLSFLEYPEFTTEENRFKCFGGVFDAAMYADFIISISQFSRTKFLETFPHYPSERVQVVSLGSRFMHESFEANRPRGVKDLEPDRFWLAVGTLEPRKNLRRLLKSFAEYADQTKIVYPLALAGGQGWLEEDLVDYIFNLGLSDRVHILGYVSDSELIWLYGNCFCFVYPSLYEGFGLPVLEAMGQGAPVITSSTTSLPEVAGNAAHLIDPLDTNGLTEAFKRLSSDKDYRQGLRKKSLMQAKRFSWNKSSSDVLNIYQRVMALPK
jgi:glycosyltransferase involved in cell wall biosynthesis